MYVKDIMTTNVVTVPSSMSIADAKRIMMAHKCRRLPVVDKGRLVGIVTENRLEQVSPSKATSLTVWEMGYLLEKTTVKEIMEKHVVTVEPDMTVEEGLAIAQSNKVGAVVVVVEGRVEGIITTNDFFYKIANKILGIGEPGVRVEVTDGGEGPALEEIISAVNKHNLRIVTLHVIAPPDKDKKDVVVHIESNNTEKLVEELRGKGFTVSVRKR
ncbi:MAG: CBS domain-containing protein [Smithellaceae bacterium]|nr:CBS domain-containing protein [Smithellaceae bacterium]